jgi:hypothetical protein
MIFAGKQIALNRVRDMEISTVELPRMHSDDHVRFETCIFYDNGSSEILRQYNTVEAAIGNHNQIFMQEMTTEV